MRRASKKSVLVAFQQVAVCGLADTVPVLEFWEDVVVV